MINNIKTVLILKSVSGAGKSTFAEILCRTVGWIECNADFFFTDKNGNYNFNPSKLGEAHAQCKASFIEALKEHTVTGIVVSNTNTTESDWKFYQDEAEKVGARVIFLVLENRHGNSDIHNLPVDVLNRQEQNILESLKLR